MAPPYTILLILLWCLAFLAHAAAKKNLTRTICYSGSTVYQRFTQVCQTLNPAYKGDWYCTKIDVCEFGMSPNRECMSTKGCAREDECFTTGSSATGVMYDGTQALSNTLGSLPAGNPPLHRYAAGADAGTDTVAVRRSILILPPRPPHFSPPLPRHDHQALVLLEQSYVPNRRCDHRVLNHLQ